MYHPEGPTFLELMRQALASTESGYDLIAPKFDHTPFRTPEPVIDAMMTAITDQRARAGTPARAGLDVCCGTGASLRRLRALCTERVVGLDFSQGMLDEAARRLAIAGAPDARVELVRGDALALPFDGAFDVVTSVGAFGHILPEDEDRFVAGIARALRPGGCFVFATGVRPRVTSSWFWVAHGFNAVMRVRNALLRPQFIMYYLTFLWPDVRVLLERHGFQVEGRRDLFDALRSRDASAEKQAQQDSAIIVVATKK